MKKGSKSLSLVLMGSLTVAMGGCGSEDNTEEFRAYQSINDCVKEQIFTQQECRDMAIAAVRQNPQFADKAECEREFGEGNCEQAQLAQNGQNVQGERQGSSWMPLIAGYMVGRYLGGGSMMQGSQPLYKQPQAAAPQQSTTGARPSGGFAGSFRTLGGGTIQADAKGVVNNPPQSVRQGFAKTAKPYVGRAGSGSRGGFAGGSSGS
ncbi:exported hypothetical protein [uncultured delta proteobacterium]|uniref:Lipoprotein n=1 Tax=uncultured delta proteobacterium TaxID=34034 RepID=A0A212JYP3_9DELT|nr:exported hypothetical protein [uncultured delta proteobacterium]